MIELKRKLSAEFEMKDLGRVKKILGMNIDRNMNKNMLKTHQKTYLEKILLKISMHNSKPVSLPIAGHFKLDDKISPIIDEEKDYMSYSNAIGSLMSSMVSTKLELSFVMSVLSRYMSNSRKKHWEAAKWLFRYIKGTSNVGLIYEQKEGTKLKLEGFVDSD